MWVEPYTLVLIRPTQRDSERLLIGWTRVTCENVIGSRFAIVTESVMPL